MATLLTIPSASTGTSIGLAESRNRRTTTLGHLARHQVPTWVALAGCVVVALVVWLVGSTLDGADASDGNLVFGTVQSVNPSDGTVCLDRGGAIECYRAPGLTLHVDDHVSVAVVKTLVDQSDPDKGNVLTIVSVGDHTSP